MNLDNECFSAIVLTRLPGLTQAQALQAILHYGTAAEALADKGRDVSEYALAFADESGLNMAMKRAEEEMAFCQEKGVCVLPVSSPAYPVRLNACPDAPAVLYYRGTANLNSRHTMAVVGTRKITDYGKRICHQLMEDFGQLLPDALVVSGLAYGVDVQTHRAALENGLETVGVMATGQDRIYPQLHEHLAEDMARHGGLLTEYLSGTRIDKGNFVRRNRIVAGMSDVIVVVESASHGGALITARLAGAYNRVLTAFPGRAGDKYSEGCNNLIRQNTAHLVTSAQDIIDILGWTPAPVQPKQEAELFPASAFSPEAQAIVDVLKGTDGLSQNRIIELTGLSAGVVSSTISILLLEGSICKLKGANNFGLA